MTAKELAENFYQWWLENYEPDQEAFVKTLESSITAALEDELRAGAPTLFHDTWMAAQEEAYESCAKIAEDLDHTCACADTWEGSPIAKSIRAKAAELDKDKKEI
jgi:hypothetical protein